MDDIQRERLTAIISAAVAAYEEAEAAELEDEAGDEKKD